MSVGPVDNATLTVINKTRNFLEHGVMPWKGLDEVDQLLLRKLSVLTQCGSVQSQRINHANVSAHLLCAMRVHLVNQTDLDIVCPKADGPWFEPKCEDDSFNWTLPISLDNEVATLNALEGSIKVLLAGYTTSIEEDEALLEGTSAEGGNGMGPTVRAAVVMRLREKQLLERALDDVSALRGKLDNNTYQVGLRARGVPSPTSHIVPGGCADVVARCSPTGARRSSKRRCLKTKRSAAPSSRHTWIVC